MSDAEELYYPLGDKVVLSLHQDGPNMRMTADWDAEPSRVYIKGIRFESRDDATAFVDLIRRIEQNQPDVTVYSSFAIGPK